MTTAPPLLDLSVVTYNSSRWLEGFFQSLLNQKFPCDQISLFIRDNGSSDETQQLCRDFLEKHGALFSSVTLSQGENLGFGHGHNCNLRSGSSPFFLVANPDLEFLPDAIEQAVSMAASDTKAVAAWEFRQEPYEHPKHYHPATLETTWISCACALFRRIALLQVGGFDEKIFLYGEDVEISFRLRDVGNILRYCPSARCRHHTYAVPGELKTEQFFGSTLANAYIRLRYGSVSQILMGVVLQLSLWIRRPKLPNGTARLLKNHLKLLTQGIFFLLSRKRSNIKFEFSRWDYGLRRSGAFYTHPKLQPDPLPLVSIVVRTCPGRSGWLEESVNSLRHQTYAPLELVLIEDGGDSARDMADALQAERCFSAVIYRSLPKVGRCRAGNVGLALASGSMIGFLDDDDLLYADHIETLARALSAHPEVAASYALAFEVGTTVRNYLPLAYEEHYYEEIHRQPFSRPLLWHHNYLPIQCVLFRRECYEQHGGLDESLENLEDWNLWTRYSLEQDFLLVEKTTSLYRVPASQAIAEQRLAKLDQYYAAAIAKQRYMRITLSPSEVMEYGQILSRDSYAIALSNASIRAFLVRHPILHKLLLRPARKLLGKIRRAKFYRPR